MRRGGPTRRRQGPEAGGPAGTGPERRRFTGPATIGAMPAKRKRARTSKETFTVEMPVALEATRDGDAWWAEIDGRELRLSNLTKVFWPDEGYTKGTCSPTNVASLIVPHLAEHPLTMKRMPDGIDGQFFYEKSAPSHTPDWLGRCVVQSDDAKGGEIDYLTIADAAGLLYVANLGCIEFHPLHSRCADVVHPDYLFFDLDPFEPYTYEDVLVVARHIKVLLDQLGLPAFPEDERRHRPADLRAGPARHLLLRPRAGVRRRRRSPDQGRRPRPGHDGVEDRRSHREDLHRPQHEPLGREHLRRVLGATRAPAPVSTPLTWDEVFEGGFEPRDFRIDNVWERFERAGDLFDGVRTEAADLRPSALEASGSTPSGSTASRRSPRSMPPAPRTAAPKYRRATRRRRRSRRPRRIRRSSSTSGGATSAPRAPPSPRPARSRRPGTRS